MADNLINDIRGKIAHFKNKKKVDKNQNTSNENDFVINREMLENFKKSKELEYF